MQNTPLSESRIRSYGYHPPSRTLELEFLNGKIYQYYGISENLYNSLKEADSMSEFFHLHIKNVYAFARVG